MNRFAIQSTLLESLAVIQRQAISDERGFLARLFCANELTNAGWFWPIRQVNHTLTRSCGAVRGMHYQVAPKAEAKLISCVRGAVWDVAIDLRQGSPTFLQWHAEELSAKNLRAMLIPPGFAHGFQALEADSELVYLHSEDYDPSCERGLNPNDPRLRIAWPLDVSTISPKDQGHAMIEADFEGVLL